MYLAEGLYVTVIGMGIVFLSLVLLLFAIKGLDRLFPARAGVTEQMATAPGPVPEASPVTSQVMVPTYHSTDGAFEATIASRLHAVSVGEPSNGSRQIVVDGVSHEVRVDPTSSGSLLIDGRAYRAEVLEAGPSLVTIRVDGTAYAVELPRAEAPASVLASSVEPTGGEPVLAPLPGKILRVSVAPGSRVERGQELCVLEAMKMENSIRSPQSAVVREVRASPGQSVSAGEPLMILGGTQ